MSEFVFWALIVVAVAGGVAVLVSLVVWALRARKLPPRDDYDMERRNARRHGNYPTEGMGGPM